ncbi:hypothetical protein AHYW_001610 [Providencia manganoxydans]|uniref:hypothetical protein n=1 Tax=Providencia manganoxydans TaxID=2923283 RepID=UPI003B9C7CAB
MTNLMRKFGFSSHTVIQLLFITANAQLLYAFWDLRNSLPLGFPVAMGISDAQAGQLYSIARLGYFVRYYRVRLDW